MLVFNLFFLDAKATLTEEDEPQKEDQVFAKRSGADTYPRPLNTHSHLDSLQAVQCAFRRGRTIDLGDEKTHDNHHQHDYDRATSSSAEAQDR